MKVLFSILFIGVAIFSYLYFAGAIAISEYMYYYYLTDNYYVSASIKNISCNGEENNVLNCSLSFGGCSHYGTIGSVLCQSKLKENLCYHNHHFIILNR